MKLDEEVDEEVDESMRISTESIGTLTSEPLRLEEEQFTRFLLLQDYQPMILVLLPRSISPSFHLSSTFSPYSSQSPSPTSCRLAVVRTPGSAIQYPISNININIYLRSTFLRVTR